MTRQVIIIGLGQIGFLYDLGKPDHIVQSHARAFSQAEGFELAAGVDPDPARRDRFAQAFSLPVFDSIEAACQSVEANVVVIASATEYHLSNLQQLVCCSKPELVIMEKPAAYTRDEAAKLLALSEQTGIPVLVNLVRRVDPSLRQVKRMLASGEIETPCKALVWYSKGAIHSACHFVDLLAWWFGGISELSAMAARPINDWDYELDFSLSCGSSRAYFFANPGDEFGYYSMEIMAQNGRLQLSPDEPRVAWQSLSRQPAGIDNPVEEINHEFFCYQRNVVDDVNRFLTDRDQVLPTLAEHLATLNPIFDLIDSRVEND